MTTNSREAQHRLGTLVYQDRHIAHTALLHLLPETARPPRLNDPLGRKTKTLTKACYRSPLGPRATVCFRAQPTDLLRAIPATAFVGIGTCFINIGQHVAVRCPFYDSSDVDTRHERVCPRAGAQVKRHQQLFDTISRNVEGLGVSNQVKSGEPFSADRNLRINILVRRGLRNAPKPDNMDKRIILDRAHADRKHRYTCKQAAIIVMDLLPLPPRRASVKRPGDISFDERGRKCTTFAVKSFGRLGVGR